MVCVTDKRDTKKEETPLNAKSIVSKGMKTDKVKQISPVHLIDGKNYL